MTKRIRLAVGSPEWFAHFENTTWRIASSGTVWINIKKHNLAIIQDYHQPEKWSYRIKDPEDKETWSTSKYKSIDEAKRPALEAFAKCSTANW